jgi:hypothetical protein
MYLAWKYKKSIRILVGKPLVKRLFEDREGDWKILWCLTSYENQLCGWEVVGTCSRFFLRRATQQKLRTHRSLKAYCATLWWRWRERWSVFLFFQVMEHRWNENDRGQPKYSGEKPVPAPLCPPQIPHWMTQDRTRASAVGGRRLTAWAMARPCSRSYSRKGFLIAELNLRVPLTEFVDRLVKKKVFDRHDSNSSAPNFVRSANRHCRYTVPIKFIFTAYLVHLYGPERQEGVLTVSEQ